LEWFGESQSVFRDFCEILKYLKKVLLGVWGIFGKETLKIPSLWRATESPVSGFSH